MPRYLLNIENTIAEKVGVAGDLVNVSSVQLLWHLSELVVWWRSWREKTIKKGGWEVQNTVGAHRRRELGELLGGSTNRAET